MGSVPDKKIEEYAGEKPVDEKKVEVATETIDTAKQERIFTKVRTVIAEQLGFGDVQITLEAKFVEDLGADSLDLVELTMAVEEEFEVDITDDDLENIHTVRELVSLLTKKVS
jgi:acyl carrier protein